MATDDLGTALLAGDHGGLGPQLASGDLATMPVVHQVKLVAPAVRLRGRVGLLVASVLALTAVVSGPASATVGERATCRFDLTGYGKNARGTGLDQIAPLPTPPTTGLKYHQSGPITCSGSAGGRSLPSTPGTMTWDGSEGTQPPQGMDTCASTNFDFTLKVTWPKDGSRKAITLSGTGAFRSLGFNGTIQGILDGAMFLGQGGVGSDPDRPRDFGYCTPAHPYTYWVFSGALALIGAPPQSGRVDHQVGVFNPAGTLGLGFQYVGGGALEVGYVTPPYSYSNAGAKLYSQPVTQGDTITFTNLDTDPHTVTSCAFVPSDARRAQGSCDPGSPAATVPFTPQLVGKDTSSPPTAYPARRPFFDGDIRQPGSSYTVETANLNPGTYSYFCEMHPYMRGSFAVSRRR